MHRLNFVYQLHNYIFSLQDTDRVHVIPLVTEYLSTKVSGLQMEQPTHNYQIQ